MRTFLGKVPMDIPFQGVLDFDPSLDSAIREVAAGAGMPASNGASAILEALANVKNAQMLFDPEDKDAFHKGMIQGLLLGAALPDLCKAFVNKPKEGSQP